LANEDIINYISNERAKGTPKETIRSNLKSVGWQDNDIESMFSKVFVKLEVPEKPDEPEQLQQDQQTQQTKPGQTKKKPLKLILAVLFILIIAGAAAYFFLFYSSCPKLAPPADQWNPVLMAHSWQNENNVEDVLDLNMNIEQGASGAIAAGNRWKNYLDSFDFKDYEVVHMQDNEYLCWKGSPELEQDPSYNYCRVSLRKKDSADEKTVFAEFETLDKKPVEVTMPSYSGFSSISWASADIKFLRSYCPKPDIAAQTQASRIKAGIDLFSPGAIREEHQLTPTTTSMNITNGMGADITLIRMKAGECERNFTNDAIKDKGTMTYILEGCSNGKEGSQLLANITIDYADVNGPHQFIGVINSEIVAEKEEEYEEGEETIPLTKPCDACIGLVYNHGGPSSSVWSGSEYGLAWYNQRTDNNILYFMRFNEAGNRTGREIRLASFPGNAKRPSVAWTGSGYNIIWPVGPSLYFIMTDNEGNKLSETDIKDQSAGGSGAEIDSASIAWAGNESGIAWSESDSKSYFARFDQEGNRIGSDMDIGYGSSSSAAAVWIGMEYGVGWIESTAADKRDYLVRIENGEKISTVKLEGDPISCQYLALSWADSRYGLASSCALKGYDELHFTRIHSTGGREEMIELDQAKAKVSNSNGASGHYAKDPSLFMTSDNYGAAWRDNRDGNDEIYFALIDAYSGSIIEKEARVTDSLPESGYPSIIKTDSNITSEYAVSWTEKDGEKQHIYFARIS